MTNMTLLQFLQQQAYKHPQDVAIREKEKGIWQQWTWAQYLDEVRTLALGLMTIGLEKGDKLAILSDNRPQVYWTMVAVQIAGGMPVPLYQDAISRELQYVIDHADATIVLAEDQEQVDKVLEIRDHLPKVRRIVYDDPKGMRHYTDRALIRFTEVQAQGQQLEKQRPELFHELVAAGKPDDVAGCVAFLARVKDSAVRRRALEGLVLALQNQQLDPPAGWKNALAVLLEDESGDVQRLARRPW